MNGLLPVAVNRYEGLVGDGDNSSEFGSENNFRHPIIENSGSWDSNNGDDNDDAVSECESVVSGSPIVEQTKIQPKVGSDGLARLDESHKIHQIIKKKIISGLRALGMNAQIETIHRNLFNGNVMARSRLHTFQVFTKAVEKNNGGDANIKYAWFGASKNEINKIITHGFGYDNIEKNGAFGYGLYLCVDHSPLESVKSSVVDSEGVRHILLCRILAGKQEAINPGSTQCCPSSEEFQTGVDNLSFPKKFVVWSNHLNTHILPEFIISFKTIPWLNDSHIHKQYLEKATSPWMPIPALISRLSKILAPDVMREIANYHRKYMERKIPRDSMIRGIRTFAGDRLLMKVLKDFKDQQEFGGVKTLGEGISN